MSAFRIRAHSYLIAFIISTSYCARECVSARATLQKDYHYTNNTQHLIWEILAVQVCDHVARVLIVCTETHS